MYWVSYDNKIVMPVDTVRDLLWLLREIRTRKLYGKVTIQWVAVEADM